MLLKNRLMVILFLLNSSFLYLQANKLTDNCRASGGKMINQIVCPNSGDVRRESFCVVKRQPLVFFNGCTGSNISGEYANLFFLACKHHDYCYHHEPNTYGRSKSTCDNRLKTEMDNVCAGLSDSGSCYAASLAFYSAVKLVGESSWKCSKSVFRY